MALTGQQFINEILLALGVYDPGETPNSTESDAALILINELIDNWNSQQLMAIADLESTFALVANTRSYTIGTGATFNIARPAKVVAASFTVLNGPTLPVQVLTAKQWQELPDRDISGNWVRFLFYDRGFPDGAATARIRVSPAPLTAGSLNISTWAATMSAAQTLGGTITFPPGYQRALKAAAAKAIASSWSIPFPAELASEYTESMSELRRLNAELWGDISPAPTATAAPIPPQPVGQGG